MMNNFKIIEFRNVKNHINRFVLKNIFIKVYIYNFSMNILIEKRGRNCVL
jgi:hypothetical protein